MSAALAGLSADVTRMRAAGYADHLELIRLVALVDGLLAQVTRLTSELVETRRELQAARSAPTRADPYVELLTSQVADLRATVATQQAMLADMTGRVLDLLERLERQAEVAASGTVPAPVRAPSPTAVPPPAASPPRDPAPSSVPASAAPPAAPADDVSHAAPALRPAGRLQAGGVDLAERASSQVPAADEPLDDETVLRLRLIRESFGR